MCCDESAAVNGKEGVGAWFRVLYGGMEKWKEREC